MFGFIRNGFKVFRADIYKINTVFNNVSNGLHICIFRNERHVFLLNFTETKSVEHINVADLLCNAERISAVPYPC